MAAECGLDSLIFHSSWLALPLLPQFTPRLAETTSDPDSKAKAKLVTMTLFLVPGTPLLRGIQTDYFNVEKGFIKSLSEFRGKESVQVGDMTFVNNTSEDVIAFARWVNCFCLNLILLLPSAHVFKVEAFSFSNSCWSWMKIVKKKV